MENVTIFNSPLPVKSRPSDRFSTIGIKGIRRGGEQPIIGRESIDRIILDLCPEILQEPRSKQHRLGVLINLYWFDKGSVLNAIRKATNRETVDFIEGIGLLINEAGINNLTELEEYFDGITSNFDPQLVCSAY